jgi:predicted RecA/RadA family phage recombinase
MKATFIQPGNAIDYKNTGSTTIKYGSIVKLGADRVGIAASDIPASEIGTLHLCGVFTCPKVTGAITLGAKLYYLEASDKLTTVASQTVDQETVSNNPVGWAVAAAASGDANVTVKLNG